MGEASTRDFSKSITFKMSPELYDKIRLFAYRHTDNHKSEAVRRMCEAALTMTGEDYEDSE